MKYYIKDNTANTNRTYIGEHCENCTLQENAVTFDTAKEAQVFADLIFPNFSTWGYITAETQGQTKMTTQNMTPEQALKQTIIQSWWEAVETLRDINLLDHSEYLTMREKLKQIIKRNGLDLSETPNETKGEN